MKLLSTLRIRGRSAEFQPRPDALVVSAAVDVDRYCSEVFALLVILVQ